MKRNIYILLAVSLFQGMVFYSSVATLYRRAAGVGIFEITIIESISLALCLVLEIPWGIIAEKIGYKNTVIFCSVLYFISKIVFWQATGFAMFLVERILLSVIISGLSGVDTAMLFMSSEEGKSQRVFALYGNLGTVGILISATVFSLFIKDDYRLAGFLTVISYGIAMLLSFGLKEVRQSGTDERQSLKETGSVILSILRNKKLLAFVIAVALLSEAHQTVTTFLNQLEYDICGLDSSQIGFVYIIVTLAGLLGILSDRFTVKFGARRFGSALYVASMAACLVLGIVNNPIAAVLCVLVLRVAFSLFTPLQTELQNREVKSRNRATELSANAMIIDSVGVATNIFFGKLADIDLNFSFLFGAGICALGLVLFLASGIGKNARE